MEGDLAAKVFTEGLKRARSNPTRESFATAIESIQNLNLGGFNVVFGPRDHVASHLSRAVDADRRRQGATLTSVREITAQ